MYDSRRTYATLLLERHAIIAYVAKQLDHAKPETTMRFYTTGYRTKIPVMSSVSIGNGTKVEPKPRKVARPGGFEPPTYRFVVFLRERTSRRYRKDAFV